MKQEKIQREIEKAKEIAREYKEKGFRVTIAPKLNDLPGPLRDLNFEPDIIAQSPDINLVIEIKSASTMRNSWDLARIANQVNNLEGWEFEFVYTNPRKTTDKIIETSPKNLFEVKSSLKRAEEFLLNDISHTYYDAALMLIWSAFEGTLRAAYLTYKDSKKQVNPQALVRNSVMLGILSKSEQDLIESMMNLKNKYAHGYDTEKVSRNELRKLVSLSKKIINETLNQNST